MKKEWVGDLLIIGEIVIIGMAGAAHLAAVSLEWNFGRFNLVFGGLVFFGLAASAGALLYARLRLGKTFFRGKDRTSVRERRFEGWAEGGLWAIFSLIVLSQIIFICMGDSNYRRGDMTVETVGSFLATDTLYQVNPMTGLPYTGGIPNRLKILCLPSLYASLSNMTEMSCAVVVWKVVPMITLVSSYTAFALLSVSLFPDTGKGACREKRVGFMAAVSLLMWVGAYQPGMDGFQLLCCGWTGITIRNLVLLPWLASLCIRRKWLIAMLCIPAEACIVWTLYGCGACLPFLLCMGILQGCNRRTGPAAHPWG